MRKLAVVVLLLTTISAWAGTCGAGYSFSRKVTLQKAQGADQSNFPYPIDLSQAPTDLQTAFLINNLGGSVQHTTTNSIGASIPADVVVCPDNTLTSTPLKYEMDGWDGTTLGKGILWTQIPTLTSASNATVYIFVGNVSVSTSQNDLTLWTDANYRGVWHLPNGSSLTLKDSSSGNDGTNHSATASPGLLDGAQLGTGSGYVQVPKVSNLNLTAAYTIEAWEMPQVTSPSGVTSVIADDFVADSNVQYEIGPYDFAGGGGPTAVFGFYNGGWKQVHYDQQPVPYLWRKLDGTWDGTNINFYIDGTSRVSGAAGASVLSSTSDVWIGKRHDNTVPPNGFPGLIDEVRIASDTKSANWLNTNWHTQAILNSTQYQAFIPSSAPILAQFTGCSSDANPTCTMPFPVTSGGVMVVLVTRIIGGTGSTACPAFSNDSAGNVYTALANTGGRYVGTLRDYDTCIYLAPITGTGSVTVTIPSGSSSSAIVMEVKNVTTSGAVGTNAGNTTQPNTMTVTSPGANSFLVCTTVGDTTNITTSTTPTYSPIIMSDSQEGVHEARTYAAWGIVGSGSQSCAFNAAPVGSVTGGPTASLAVLPSSSGVRVRHRSQVY